MMIVDDGRADAGVNGQSGSAATAAAPTLEDVHAARRRTRAMVAETPLVRSALSDRAGAEILLKLEIFQPIGAFKIRGAANAVALLTPEARARGVACCSTGNHGRALAYAARAAGVKAVVCLSSLAPEVKAQAIADLGAEVRRIGASQDDAQREVDRLVAEEGFTDIPPFDHPAVIAGQGAIALEIFEARPDIETLVVPLSGGGLLGGIALAAKAINPAVKVIGVSMDRGAAMAESLKAGRPVEVEEVASLADSLGGGVGLGNRWTFPLCRDLVDEVVLLSEAEIYRGMRALFLEDRLVAEGAAAVAHGALLAGKLRLDGPTAFIISGRNVDMAQFGAVAAGQSVRLGDLTVEG